jgi:hypothetical protein
MRLLSLTLLLLVASCFDPHKRVLESERDTDADTDTDADSDTDTDSDTSDSAGIGNTPPTVSGLSLLATTDLDGDGDSATAGAADTLECSWTFDDLDGDSDVSTVEWFVNSVSTGSGTTLSGAFTGGDRVSCTVTPNDGTVDGTPVDSEDLTIGNTPPTVSGVSVLATTNVDGDGDSTTAVTGDTMECSWTFSDIDGAPDNSTVEWFNGSTSLGSSTSLSGGFVGGDTLTCTVTPNDGMVDGVADSGSLLITNTPPGLASVTLAPVPAYPGDSLQCIAGAATDADSHPITFTYAWYINGVLQGATSDTLSSGFVAGDTVMCMVTPNDGIDNGVTMAVSMVISDTDDRDSDGDGFTPNQGDCDDADASEYPGVTWYSDVDGDGFGDASSGNSCERLDNSDVLDHTDCDDTDVLIYPGATETIGDEIDQDCDHSELCYSDADADGFIADTLATVVSTDSDCDDLGEAGASQLPADDCYDSNSSVFPGQTAYFSIDRGDGSYDYDCDTAETQQWTDAGYCDYSFFACSGDVGWLSTTPACGDAASWQNGCEIGLNWSDCDVSYTTITQECR